MLADEITAELRAICGPTGQRLALFPPDNTASNRNPGDPGTRNPPQPAEHGRIHLEALFQLLVEGME